MEIFLSNVQIHHLHFNLRLLFKFCCYLTNTITKKKTLELITKEKYLGFVDSDSCYDEDYINNEIGNVYARGNNAIIRHSKYCSSDVNKGKVIQLILL